MEDVTGNEGTTAADRWMTYVELSSLLGVSLEAAKRRAGRGKWPRRLQNEDGRARVLVPGNVMGDVAPNATSLGTAVVGDVIPYIGSNRREDTAALTTLLQAETEARKRVEAEAARLRLDLTAAQREAAASGTRAAVAEEAVRRLEETLREVRAERDRPGWMGRILADMRSWRATRG